MKDTPHYYCINWDFNIDNIEYYDIMPYLIETWEEQSRKLKNRLRNLKRHKERDFKAEANCIMPSTFEGIKEWIKDESMYQFWSRCQYEVIVTGFPQQKREYKLDIYEQIEMNIDVITKIFMEYLNTIK